MLCCWHSHSRRPVAGQMHAHICNAKPCAGRGSMLAGVDVSGDVLSGSHKFMGLVIGTDERIRAMVGRIGHRPIHMRRLPRPERNAVVDKIVFDRTTCAGFCIRIEKNRILAKIEGLRRQKRGFKSRKRLSRTYNALLWSMLRIPVEPFLYAHGIEPSSLCLQCDRDCQDFVNDQGWRHTDRGPAYELADALAWGNGHGREPEGTVFLDLAGRLEEHMLKRFK